MKHNTTAHIPPPTSAQQAHEADRAYFRAHPQARWRIRPVAAGEFEDNGHASRATHVVVLTTPTRSRWAARPLTLPVDASDEDVEAAGRAAIFALLVASA